MAHIGALHPEDHVLGDVGGVVGHALQIAGHQQRIQRLPHHVRALIHGLDQLDEGFVAHAVDHVVHFEHGLRQFDLAFNERLQRAAHHGADRRTHAGNIDRQVRQGSSTISMTRSAMLTA